MLPSQSQLFTTNNPQDIAISSVKNQAFTYSSLEEEITHWVGRLSHLKNPHICIKSSFPTSEILCLILATLKLQGTVSLLNTRLTADHHAHQLSLLAAGATPAILPTQNQNIKIFSLPDSRPETRASVILFTSGSKSRPKAVVLSVEAIVAHLKSSNLKTGLNRKCRWLLTLPIYHAGGLLIPFRVFQCGGSIKLIDSYKRPDILTALHSDPLISHISLIPEMLSELLDLGAEKILRDRLKLILLGGAPVSQSLREKIRHLKLPVWVGYGSTETCSHITLGKISENESSTYCGTPIEGTRITILPSTPGATIGTIAIQSPSLMTCYLSDERLCKQSLFETQDLGYIDADAALHVVGRSDDIINSGGEKINPFEVESKFSGIAVKIAGFPHRVWGERPVMFLSDTETKYKDLEKILKTLPKLHKPDLIIRIKEFPLTATEKISKQKLKDTYKRFVEQNWDMGGKLILEAD